MSRFFNSDLSQLVPYTPGEQPPRGKYVKLNTNESPFPPAEKTLKKITEAAKELNLYSDPSLKKLTEAAKKVYDVSEDEIIFSNGSDEILDFAFIAFCNSQTPAVFADITYGFYPVFANINKVPYREIPLENDFSISPQKYYDAHGTVFIANPNAPTGLYLTTNEIEKILLHNTDHVVVIDEAYIDFGSESCLPLIKKYDNLLVVRTFSKSRSMAGARLGYAFGNKKLIADLNTIKFSVNPYNVNSMTEAAGIGAFESEDYTMDCCRQIVSNREYAIRSLTQLGFEVTDSKANFIFVRTPLMSGQEFFESLRENGILVRHFTKDRIRDWNRISIGTREQMELLIRKTQDILSKKERK